MNLSPQKSGAPCKDCPDRHLSCHNTCPRYRGWVAECDQCREKWRAEKKLEKDVLVSGAERHKRVLRIRSQVQRAGGRT